MWKIQPVQIDQAQQLSDVARQIFRDTFGPFNSASDMDLYVSEAFTPMAMAAAITDAQTGIMAAIHDGRFIGYAHVHRGEAPAVINATTPVELKRFYIVQKWHGTGLAQELLKAAADWSRSQGADIVWLGVWEHNARAIRFYHNYGFKEVGEQEFILGTDHQRDFIMAAPVGRLDSLLENAIAQRSRNADGR